MAGPMEAGAMYIAPTDLSNGSRTGSRDGTAPQSGVSTSDGGTPRTSDSQERGAGTGTASNCTDGSSVDKMSHSQDMDWVRMTDQLVQGGVLQGLHLYLKDPFVIQGFPNKLNEFRIAKENIFPLLLCLQT